MGNRVAAGLLSAVLLAAPLLVGSPSAASDVAPTPEPVAEGCSGTSEESPVQVEVTTLLPRAPARADQPFQVAGRLRNCGAEPLDRLQVRLSVGGRLSSRGELQRAEDEPVVGAAVLSVEAGDDRLEPGQSTPFDLRLLVGRLGLGDLGVYPLSVQARARYGDDRARTGVGLASTFVPWFPDGPPAPTRVAWLWPLIDQPRRGPAEVMLDEELEELLSPEQPRGRLQELLVGARKGSQGACDPTAAPPPDVPRDSSAGCRGEPVPVTYAIDPSLLYSVEAMVAPGGYSVLVDGKKQDRPKSQNAEQWLVGLRAAATEADVLALPFGDPDVVAMSRLGSGLRDEVEQLRKLGQSETRRLLYPPDSSRGPLTSVVWPPPGPLDGGALDLLVRGEAASSVVLDVEALPPASAARNRTPSARTELASKFEKVTGLVVEDVLSDLVAPDPARWQGPRLAEQRFIAETAMIAAEVPSESRTLLIAPDRTADIGQAGLAEAMIADTGRLPWLCPVSLAAVAQERERCAGLPDAQPPAEAEEYGDVPPPTGRGDELPPSFLERLARVQAAADQFTEAVLVDTTDRSAQTKRRLLRATGRAASAAWRDQPLLGDQMLRLLQEDVTGLRRKVRLVSRPVTLTGGSGVLLLAVQNELDQPVNVGVRLDETSAARLSSADTDVQVVPARESTQIEVRVEPQTSGRFVVLATLVDEQGRPFGEEVELDVRSTQYGRVALGVTGVAAAVLMVAAGARITRRALRRPTPVDSAG